MDQRLRAAQVVAATGFLQLLLVGAAVPSPESAPFFSFDSPSPEFFDSPSPASFYLPSPSVSPSPSPARSAASSSSSSLSCEAEGITSATDCSTLCGGSYVWETTDHNGQNTTTTAPSYSACRCSLSAVQPCGAGAAAGASAVNTTVGGGVIGGANPCYDADNEAYRRQCETTADMNWRLLGSLCFPSGNHQLTLELTFQVTSIEDLSQYFVLFYHDDDSSYPAAHRLAADGSCQNCTARAQFARPLGDSNGWRVVTALMKQTSDDGLTTFTNTIQLSQLHSRQWYFVLSACALAVPLQLHSYTVSSADAVPCACAALPDVVEATKPATAAATDGDDDDECVCHPSGADCYEMSGKTGLPLSSLEKMFDCSCGGCVPPTTPATCDPTGCGGVSCPAALSQVVGESSFEYLEEQLGCDCAGCTPDEPVADPVCTWWECS